MTLAEAVEKMHAAVEAAKERLSTYGFVTSVETDYMNSMLRTVTDAKKARYVTVSLVVGAVDGKEGEEYCMSVGANIVRGSIDDEQLAKDLSSYGQMVDEAIAVLEEYEEKNEGLKQLTEKANAEYEKLLARIKEEQEKSRRISMIINTVFIVGIMLLLIVSFLR